MSPVWYIDIFHAFHENNPLAFLMTGAYIFYQLLGRKMGGSVQA